MRFDELIEGANVPSIIVDVQPAYSSGFTEEYVRKMVHFIAKQKAPILMLVNADETGMTEDNVEHEILPWWEEAFSDNGLDFYDDGFNKMTFFDKGYGYLRGAMDLGVDDSLIIKTIREMYQQRVYDSRELFDGDEETLAEFLGDEDAAQILLTDAISVEWISIGLLRQYAGYLAGGGRNECLKEVALLMNAFNIRYKLINDLIYG